MKRTMMTVLLLMVSNVLKGLGPYRKASVNMTKLKLSILYVKSIATLRGLFITFWGIAACFTFLFAGLMLFHIGIWLYAPWSFSTKMAVTFGFAGFYVITSVGIFSYIFDEAKWMKIFNADKLAAQWADRTAESLSKE